MSEFKFIISFAFWAGIVFFLIHFSLRAYRFKKKSIQELSQLTNGFVFTSGRVKATENLLESPYHKQKCVAFNSILTETNHVRGPHSESITGHMRDYMDFSIADNHNQKFIAKVKTKKARIYLEGGKTHHFFKGTTLSSKNKSYFDFMEQKYPQGVFPFDTSIQETVLKNNDPVFIMGRCKVQKDGTMELTPKRGYPFISDKSPREHVSTQFWLIGLILLIVLMLVSEMMGGITIRL